MSSSTLRFSIRICGTVTSLSLRKNLISLWLTLSYDLTDKQLSDKSHLQGLVLNFIYEKLEKWEGESGKGFSDYISESMIEDILELEDIDTYQNILTAI